MYQKCMIPKMPFLSFYIFHGSSKPIPMKLQSWSPLGAEVFGLHGLGKFTSFGRSLGGWNWAVWNVPKKPWISTGEIRNLQRWSFSLEVTVCGRYSISCLGLYTFIYKGKRGEEMNELQVTRISIHDVVIAPKTFEFVFWLVGVLCFVFWFLDYCSWLLAWLSRFWPSNTSTCWEV